MSFKPSNGIRTLAAPMHAFIETRQADRLEKRMLSTKKYLTALIKEPDYLAAVVADVPDALMETLYPLDDLIYRGLINLFTPPEHLKPAELKKFNTEINYYFNFVFSLAVKVSEVTDMADGYEELAAKAEQEQLLAGLKAIYPEADVSHITDEKKRNILDKANMHRVSALAFLITATPAMETYAAYNSTADERTILSLASNIDYLFTRSALINIDSWHKKAAKRRTRLAQTQR